MRPLAVVLILGGWAAAAAPAVPAASAYDAGRAAYQAGDFDAAQRHFETALGLLPAGDPLRGPTMYNLARTTQELGAGCRAAQRFEVYLDATADDPDEARRRDKAQTALAESQAACRAQTPVEVKPDPIEVTEPRPPSEARIWPWVATGSAAVVLATGIGFWAVARGDVTEADQAYQRFVDGGRRSAAERDRVETSRESAESNRALSYTFLSVGVALAGVSAWLWLDGPDEGVSIRVGPGGAVAGWRF